MQKTQGLSLRPRADKHTAYKRLTADIGGDLGLYREALWNSHERGGAEHIWIEIQSRGKNYRVVISDDGCGMGPAMLERFLSLAVTDEERGGRNYQDLGTKRFLHDFEFCELKTICADEPDGPLRRLVIDYDRYLRILAEEIDEDLAVEELPRDPVSMDLPAGATGTRLEFWGLRENRPHPTAEALRKRLAEMLPLEIADKVYVGGLPLEKRLIVGEPLRFESRDPVLGLVKVNLYVPKSVSRHDELSIGASEPVVPWRKFSRQIPETVVSSRLNVLDDAVFGTILVENFGRSVTPQRDSFEVGLYASKKMDAFVQFIEREVVDQLARIVGDVKRTKMSDREQQVTDEINQYLSFLGGGGDEMEPVLPPVYLTLKPSALELQLGVKKFEMIEVTQRDSMLTLQWHGSACGGRIEVLEEGLKVKYWPGSKVGRYLLTASYKERPDVKAHVEILLVAHKQLRVQPFRVTVPVSKEVTLTAVNVEEDSTGADNLVWSLDKDDSEGRFMARIRGRMVAKETGLGGKVIYRAGSIPGTYRLELIDSKNRLKTAYCDVTVTEMALPSVSPVSGSGGKAGRGGLVEVEGMRYKVGFDSLPQFPDVLRVITHGDRHELIVNRDHKVLMHVDGHRGDSGIVELVWNRILEIHIEVMAEKKGETVTGPERRRRFADLYAGIAQKIEEREKGT